MRSFVSHLVRMIFASLLASSLFAPRVWAGLVNVTLTGPTSITMQEDLVLRQVAYWLTNNSPVWIFLRRGDTGWLTRSGDTSDIPVVAPPLWPGDCGGNFIFDGETCPVIVTLVPVDGPGETDADFGTGLLQLNVYFDVYIDPSNPVPVDTVSASITTTVTMTDPGYTAPSVPEPSSLVLLGSAAIGILAAFRRRLRLPSR